MKIIIPKHQRDAIKTAITNNFPCLLIGETGTGKTSIVHEVADKLKRPYVRVNMSGYTTPDELIGSKSVKAGATYYEQGIITDAMIKGAVLVLDEINATPPDCLFILHGLLDDDRRITLPNGEVITPAKGFRVFATCNPDYEGTKTMNKAFIDRFPIVLEIKTLGEAREAKLIDKLTGIGTSTAIGLVKTATLARKAYTEGKIGLYLSTRSLINIAKLINNGIEAKLAYSYTVSNKGAGIDERNALQDFYSAVHKSGADKPEAEKYIIIETAEVEAMKNEVDKAGQALKQVEALNDQIRIKSEAIEDLKAKLETVCDLETKLQAANTKLEAFVALKAIIKQANKA